MASDEAGDRAVARSVSHDVLGETTNRFLGNEVQHLVEVLSGEDFPVGAAVAAHSAVFVQDEEEATGIACALCVLVA
ncbi:hypothetical protein M2163_000075 [Streptomyces sp. SAI-135]|uniref:hypothetical protein n=1 Tax=unclassified Streptomyces TaxID=2593676 RepID=UPI00247549B2|nr:MULTISPECIES: hypothetical protein [unclassified Streptomyces]MDH6523420.1 hypothetical protein [Streptomyces sp. SAI-090]MDH6555042.1 hypothetical protein [Streptomyces sp. SAI-041]MDH6574307.1 hypothetical protein [Streptomyces sp. SAI-117]MDH6580961.1 hypothetical protein [Streptomyces sp. SAI-133]MDH6612967.1 hypothetical protein [Streptomyces sp. SAI-135]